MYLHHEYRISRILPASPRCGNALIALALYGCSADADSTTIQDAAALATVCASCAEEERCQEALTVSNADHVLGPVDYPDIPPVGGSHHPCWADYRVYDSTDALPAERWVHNLEHGGVVFLYHCPEACPEEVTDLTALQETLPRTILTPYTAMEPGFAVVSWEHRLTSTCLDVEAFRAFYNAHFDRAPESISGGEPSACEGIF